MQPRISQRNPPKLYETYKKNSSQTELNRKQRQDDGPPGATMLPPLKRPLKLSSQKTSKDLEKNQRPYVEFRNLPATIQAKQFLPHVQRLDAQMIQENLTPLNSIKLGMNAAN